MSNQDRSLVRYSTLPKFDQRSKWSKSQWLTIKVNCHLLEPPRRDQPPCRVVATTQQDISGLDVQCI